MLDVSLASGSGALLMAGRRGSVVGLGI
jgi:hypothetical protein